MLQQTSENTEEHDPFEHCLSCCRKHISKAAALIEEYLVGFGAYDTHLWRAVGELCEAERACLLRYLSLAVKIRLERVKMIDSITISFDGARYREVVNYFPDFDALIEEATGLFILEKLEANDGKDKDIDEQSGVEEVRPPAMP
jgi:hypothetical protein